MFEGLTALALKTAVPAFLDQKAEALPNSLAVPGKTVLPCSLGDLGCSLRNRTTASYQPERMGTVLDSLIRRREVRRRPAYPLWEKQVVLPSRRFPAA